MIGGPLARQWHIRSFLIVTLTVLSGQNSTLIIISRPIIVLCSLRLVLPNTLFLRLWHIWLLDEVVKRRSVCFAFILCFLRPGCFQIVESRGITHSLRGCLWPTSKSLSSLGLAESYKLLTVVPKFCSLSIQHLVLRLSCHLRSFLAFFGLSLTANFRT